LCVWERESLENVLEFGDSGHGKKTEALKTMLKAQLRQFEEEATTKTYRF